MNEFGSLGKVLILLGALLLLAGLVFVVLDKLPISGKIPGNFSFRKGNWEFHFPLATSILISILGTLLLYFFRKL
jgi:hypothetical protein